MAMGLLYLHYKDWGILGILALVDIKLMIIHFD